MLMDGNRTQDLRRMYTLFSRVGALESIRQALSLYIRKTGQSIVTDEEKEKDMVFSLLEFKMSLDKIWEDSFSKNDVFSNTIKEAFEHLINLRQVPLISFCHKNLLVNSIRNLQIINLYYLQNRPAELIAKFLDEKLRAGNKGTSEEELEGTLDKVLVLFRFIQVHTHRQ